MSRIRESPVMYYDSPFLFSVFIIFAVSAAVQLFYYLWFYLAVYTYKNKDKQDLRPPVSVIICARNEAENLKNFLPAVLEQDYPEYEVIVVNDCSEDNSYDILGNYIVKYPHLRISNVNKDPKFTHNKKFAQFIGIKAAKNDILVFTDADCRPESGKWLDQMVSNFDGNTDFVLGYGGYFTKAGLLNRYIHYDCMTIAMQYLGMAIRGVPYMAVGRNLAYRRQVFFDNKGFGSYNHVVSGDDDLFVNTNAGKKNTSVEFRQQAHTRSVPETSFRKWFIMKKRHLTTAPYYRVKHKILLFLEPLTRILFYASLVILLANLFMWPYLAVIFGARLITQITVLALASKKLNEPGLIGYSLIFDIISPFLNSVINLSNLKKRFRVNQWK